MYNTMYGGSNQSVQSQQQSTPGQPIHIKIEDQTGVPSTNPQTTKKQFQQTSQKFVNTAVKAQHVMQNPGHMTTTSKGKISANSNP
jgi:hypothetical protein